MVLFNSKICCGLGAVLKLVVIVIIDVVWSVRTSLEITSMFINSVSTQILRGDTPLLNGFVCCNILDGLYNNCFRNSPMK